MLPAGARSTAAVRSTDGAAPLRDEGRERRRMGLAMRAAHAALCDPTLPLRPLLHKACPTCDDDTQNGDEAGVDCGGSSCPACPTCDDGEQNGDETSVDTGGSCPETPWRVTSGQEHCEAVGLCVRSVAGGNGEYAMGSTCSFQYTGPRTAAWAPTFDVVACASKHDVASETPETLETFAAGFACHCFDYQNNAAKESACARDYGPCPLDRLEIDGAVYCGNALPKKWDIVISTATNFEFHAHPRNGGEWRTGKGFAVCASTAHESLETTQLSKLFEELGATDSYGSTTALDEDKVTKQIERTGYKVTAQEVLAQADTDNSGKVDQGEFTSWYQSNEEQLLASHHCGRGWDCASGCADCNAKFACEDRSLHACYWDDTARIEPLSGGGRMRFGRVENGSCKVDPCAAAATWEDCHTNLRAGGPSSAPSKGLGAGEWAQCEWDNDCNVCRRRPWDRWTITIAHPIPIIPWTSQACVVAPGSSERFCDGIRWGADVHPYANPRDNPIWAEQETYDDDRGYNVLRPFSMDVDADGAVDLLDFASGRFLRRTASGGYTRVAGRPMSDFGTWDRSRRGQRLPGTEGGPAPSAADLNGDGVQDLVLGTLGASWAECARAFVAVPAEGAADAAAGGGPRVSYVETSRPPLAFLEGMGQYAGDVACGLEAKDGVEAGLAADDDIGDSGLDCRQFWCAPAFVDVDGDEFLDLVLSGYSVANPQLRFFRRSGPGTAEDATPAVIAAVYTEVTGSASPFEGVIGSGTPNFVDLDSDGDLDLVIGKWDGEVQSYRRDSVPTVRFTRLAGAADPFDGVRAGDSHRYPSGGQDIVASQAGNPWTSSSNVHFTDVDFDGDLDLLVSYGDTPKSDTPDAPILYTNTQFFRHQGGKRFEWGSYTKFGGPGSPFDGLRTNGVNAPAYARVDGQDMLLVRTGQTVASRQWRLLRRSTKGEQGSEYVDHEFEYTGGVPMCEREPQQASSLRTSYTTWVDGGCPDDDGRFGIGRCDHRHCGNCANELVCTRLAGACKWQTDDYCAPAGRLLLHNVRHTACRTSCCCAC